MEKKEENLEMFGGAKLVSRAVAGSDEWHDARSGGIGGSEVGAILGLNEYESPISLWAKKTGKVEPEVVDNWSVRFGKAFETPILELWLDQNPDWWLFVNLGTYSHKDYDFLRANVDAIVEHKETKELMVVEIKTARYSWTETPPSYKAQLLHYMDVLNIKRGVIVAVAGWNWWEDYIDYDQFEADAQRQQLIKFWKYVTEDIQPDYDGADATYQTVRKLHPDIDPEAEVEIDGVWDLANKQSEFDQVKAELTELKSRILDLMGNAKHAYFEYEGEKIRVASRISKSGSTPYLQIRKVKK